MKHITTLLLCIFLLFLSSCESNYSRLEYALEAAGENRKELEKVLQHYENDSLKLKAAVFLIENMPAYYSYEGAVLDSMKAALATGEQRGYVEPEIKNRWRGYSYKELPKVYDVQVITAEYLIKNIDQAFHVWRKRPWGKYLEFDDFCEYILPYRIGNEPLEEWREVYYDDYGCLLDSVYQGTDVVKAANLINNRLRREGFFYNAEFDLPHLGALYNLNHRIGNCKDMADITTYLFRALGIPVAIDFFNYSPESLLGHSWNVVKDTTGECLPFAFGIIKRSNRKVNGMKIGKAFRTCFGQQSELYPGISKDAKVPPFFKYRYSKDSSSDYFENSIEVNITDTQEKYLYLGVFRGKEWMGIDMARIKNGKAVFHNLEPGIIYEPLYYDGTRYLPAGYPVFIGKDSTNYQLTPDTIRKEQVKLSRKYPYFWRIKAMGGRVAGAKIEYATDKSFSSPRLLHQIKDSATTCYNPVQLSVPVKCRYIRYTAAQNTWLELAELQFYNGNKQIMPINAESEKVEQTLPKIKLKNCYDNDPLTFITSSGKGGSITFDLGSSVVLDRIVYMPRNDDNFIRPSDIYELYYQAGEKGWVLLGRQLADSAYLTYSNVPGNALLYLHNVTRGREEFPFYMKEGKQVFSED